MRSRRGISTSSAVSFGSVAESTVCVAVSPGTVAVSCTSVAEFLRASRDQLFVSRNFRKRRDFVCFFREFVRDRREITDSCAGSSETVARLFAVTLAATVTGDASVKRYTCLPSGGFPRESGK